MINFNSIIQDSFWRDLKYIDYIDFSTELSSVDPNIPCEEELIHMEKQIVIEEQGSSENTNNHLDTAESVFVDVTEYFTTNEVCTLNTYYLIFYYI